MDAEKVKITIEGPGPLKEAPSPIDWTRPVQTKNGTPVRIIAIDHTLDRPVIGVIMGEGLAMFRQVSDWGYNGRYAAMTTGSDCLDLVNVPEVSK
jgi:hypothetical protein